MRGVAPRVTFPPDRGKIREVVHATSSAEEISTPYPELGASRDLDLEWCHIGDYLSSEFNLLGDLRQVLRLRIGLLGLNGVINR